VTLPTPNQTQAEATPEQRFLQALAVLLEVPYPLLLIRAYEEVWLVEEMAAFAATRQRHLWLWTCVRGLHALHPDAAAPPPCQGAALADALVALFSVEAPALLVVLDPGHALDDEVTQRLLRELAYQMPQRRQSIALIGAEIDAPPLLSREVASLDAPLPSRSCLAGLLDEALPPLQVPLLPRERMVSAALGLTRAEAFRAFVRVGLQRAHDPGAATFDWERAVLDEKRRAIGRDDVAQFIENQEDLSTVGGMEDLKEWLATRQAAFTAEARAFGLPAPKGLLLVGVQGCGKSLLAKAVAHHWGLPLLRLDLGAIFGTSLAPDAALRRALAIADAMAPAILWTDEIEKGFSRSGDATTQRILGSLLTWLQEKRSEVFFVATANEVHELPPELIRKGRFDDLFFVDLPDRQARAQIFAIHIRKRGRKPGDFDLGRLADLTESYSGAEIEEVVTAALFEAFADGRPLEEHDLVTAIEETVPLYRTHQDAIKSLREWARDRTRTAAKDSRLVNFFDDADL